jgi:hypothetical protein
MDGLLERSRAYLPELETAREAALALCEQKAEEARLIKARQEGFQTAMEMLHGDVVRSLVETAAVIVTALVPALTGTPPSY